MTDDHIEARLDMIGIVVSDMARALAFYRLLGLDIPASADDEGHVEVAMAGGMRLAFDTEAVLASFHPHWRPASAGEGRVGIAFLVSAPAAVDAVWRRLTDAGHASALEPFDAPWGQRYATVRDPDGSAVDLFAPLG